MQVSTPVAEAVKNLGVLAVVVSSHNVHVEADVLHSKQGGSQGEHFGSSTTVRSFQN